MKARHLLMVVLSALTISVAACSSSGGPHVQSYSPSPTENSTTSSSRPPTSSSSPTNPKSSTSSKPSTMPVSTPAVAPAGQGAVNAYIAFYNVLTTADRDPAHADTAALNRYLTGSAKALFDGAIKGQAADHLAYRGTPDDPRVTLGQVVNPSFLFLSSCPRPSKSDPFVQYDVRTGKAVKITNPQPKVERVISMKKTSGAWQVSGFTTGNKKCSP